MEIINKLLDLIPEKRLVFLAREAFTGFLSRKFQYMDPHVGDTSCQIRACQFFELLNNQAFCQKIRSYLGCVNLNLEIFQNDIYALLICFSYLLSVSKISDEHFGSVAIDHHMVKNYLSVSITRAKNIVKLSQQFVSGISCQYVIECGAAQDFNLAFLLKSLLRKGDDSKFILPCFFLSHVLLNRVLKKFIPIKITVKFQNGSCYHYSDSNFIKSHHNPAIHFVYLVECMPSQDVIRYLDKNFVEIFYTNQALHPQYCGKKLSSWRKIPFSYDEFLSIKDFPLVRHFFSCIKGASRSQKKNKNALKILLHHVRIDGILGSETPSMGENQKMLIPSLDTVV